MREHVIACMELLQVVVIKVPWQNNNQCRPASPFFYHFSMDVRMLSWRVSSIYKWAMQT